ncbi:MAG: endonuclease VIII [Xanthomonadales bacterium]|nr:endonuclease VIII [Xanthomonadales bacterium]
MPEGPEIRRAADRIGAVLVGERLDSVEFSLDALRPFERKLTGARVQAVDTRGKAMLTRFDNDLTLYSHNQLYGRWFTVRRGQWPRTNRSLRVALHTGTHSALLYSASDIEVLTPGEVETHRFLSRLGPDALDPALDAPAIAARLDEARFRRRSLAALYLDQGFLAGLGNYLRSEILFRAGLQPRLRPVDLDAPQRRRLARETLKLCRRSYETGGVTLPASRVRGRQRFWVFARASKPCRECGSRVRRENLSGRRIYHCPACQAAPA